MRRFLIAKLAIFFVIIGTLSTGQVNRAYSEQSCHPNKPVDRASFSTDGKLVLANWGESVARLWDVDTGKALHTFTYGSPTKFWTLELSPDYKTVAAAIDDRAIVWDVATEKVKYEFRPKDFEIDAYYGNTAFYVASKNGKELVLLGGNSISSWSVETGNLLWEIRVQLDRRWLATQADLILTYEAGTGSESGAIKLWNAANGQKLRQLKDSDLIGNRISSDGKYFFVFRWVDQNSAFVLQDRNSNKVLFTHDSTNDDFYAVDISPDGKHIMGYTGDDFVLLDVRTDKVQINFGSYYEYTNFYWLPNDQLLVLRSKPVPDVQIEIVDLDSGQRTLVVTLPIVFTNPSKSVDISAHRQYLLAGAIEDPALSLWDIRTGKLVRIFC